jgi:hypothetical protein
LIACGNGGKQGLSRLTVNLFSKTPQFHNGNLENPTTCQVPTPQLFQKIFHFSSLNYGYYYLFYISFILFLIPRLAGKAAIQKLLVGNALPIG